MTMKRRNFYPPLFGARMLLALAVFCYSASASASAQSPGIERSEKKGAPVATDRPNDDPVFEGAYQNFYASYRLGPGDVIAVRVQGQPEYSKDHLKVSPVGTIYLELLGEVAIAAMTIQQAKDYLAKELGEYLRDPKVTISLIEAMSAKIAILGEVLKPGVVVLARPMTLLDAISEAGGFANTGSKSNVELNRQRADGSRMSKRFNLKHILEGKAKSDENAMLQTGDIVYVHGNMMKTVSTVTSLAGFGNFLSFIMIGRR